MASQAGGMTFSSGLINYWYPVSSSLIRDRLRWSNSCREQTFTRRCGFSLTRLLLKTEYRARNQLGRVHFFSQEGPEMAITSIACSFIRRQERDICICRGHYLRNKSVSCFCRPLFVRKLLDLQRKTFEITNPRQPLPSFFHTPMELRALRQTLPGARLYNETEIFLIGLCNEATEMQSLGALPLRMASLFHFIFA